MMFPLEPGADLTANTLSICVQPDEGFHIEFQAKTPNIRFHLESVDLEFHYQSAFGDQAIPDAYEQLLLDTLDGDASLFARSDEIEHAPVFLETEIRVTQGGKSTQRDLE